MPKKKRKNAGWRAPFLQRINTGWQNEGGSLHTRMPNDGTHLTPPTGNPDDISEPDNPYNGTEDVYGDSNHQ